MKNNLQTLNHTLFETLEKLQKKEITKEEAKVINEIAGTIINNAKVQLDAVKITKGMGSNAELFGVKTLGPTPDLNDDDLYNLKMEFSIFKGHSNVSNAIGALGKFNFEKEFNIWLEKNKSK